MSKDTYNAKVINIKGDPRNPEPADHIINYPGGFITVTRTSNNEYWVHIGVNHGQVLEGMVMQGKRGEVIESRIDYDYPITEIPELDNMPQINHIAVRIKTN